MNGPRILENQIEMAHHKDDLITHGMWAKKDKNSKEESLWKVEKFNLTLDPAESPRSIGGPN